jgi:hypothetical protein
MADQLAGSGRALRDAVGLTLHSIDTPPPSGRLGRVHLAVWPAFQRKLLRRGVRADGPDSVQPNGPPGRGRPTLSWRLYFDPTYVGLQEPAVWLDPPVTAVELGLPRAGGRMIAGIAYLASVGTQVGGWSDVLPDPAEADERGGRVPFLIHHGRRELPSPEQFGPPLGRALREAADGLLDRALCQEVVADFKAKQMPTLALVRPGPRVTARLDGQGYARLVRAAAAALIRYGVPVVEPGAQTPLMTQQLLRDTSGFPLDWDYHILAFMLVTRGRAGEPQMTDEVRHLQAITSGTARTLIPAGCCPAGYIRLVTGVPESRLHAASGIRVSLSRIRAWSCATCATSSRSRTSFTSAAPRAACSSRSRR